MPEFAGLAELTGVLAVILVFLSGPYRTIQKRWPRMWGPVLSVWAHGNVSLAAAIAVFAHVMVVGEFELEIFPVEPSVDPPLLDYIATTLFTGSLGSGFFGLYVATVPRARQRWLSFHRSLTSVFYLSLLPHIFTEGIIQWPVFLLLLAAWAMFAGRSQMIGGLARAGWPLAAKSATKVPSPPTHAGAPTRRRAAFAVVTALILLAGVPMALLLVTRPTEDQGIEVYGTIGDVSDGSFTLTTGQGPERVVLSAETEFKDERGLRELQRTEETVEVEGVRQPDGSLVASHIEIEGGEYSD